MKKLLTEKEQVYVINQPKHITSSVIVVGDIFPLPENIHNGIEQLCEVSDVLLVFAPTHFAHQKTINFDRFASLYRSCAWIESGAFLGSTIIKLLKYDKEIFDCHRNTIFYDFQKIGDINTDRIMSIVASSLSKPILEISRLGTEEFYDIYRNNEEDKIILPWIPKAKNMIKAFCSYKATSDIVFLRENTVNTILNFCEGTGFSKTYVESFTDSDIMYFLGSIIRYLGIDYLDRDYKTIKLQ